MPMPVKKSTTTGAYSPGDVHFNQPLTSVAVNTMWGANQQDGYVAASVFPPVPVEKQSDRYYVLDNEHLADSGERRAPGTPSAGGTLKSSHEPYYCDVWGWHMDIPDQMRKNADGIFRLDSSTARSVAAVLKLGQEIAWATTFFLKSAWDYSADGAATESAAFDPTDDGNNDRVYWDDPDSTPIEDVQSARRTVLVGNGAGYRPNKLVLARAVYDALLNHPDIIARLDRGQTSGPAMATRADLAALFEVEEVLVMDAVKRAATGNQFVQPNGALLAFAPSSPGLNVPSAGYTFVWSGYTGQRNLGTKIKKFRMEELASDRIEGEAAYQHKVVAKSLGYFFNDIVENTN